jgi:NAD(P)-dependent dehydrogenase (short-subunit alcohol dehydrogenase family)
MLPPDGRVILISGANRGIGRAIAELLHAQGYSLSLGGRDLNSLRTMSAEWDPSRLHIARYDATDWTSHRAWIDAAAAHFGRIDGLVNNAGITQPVRTLEIGGKDFDAIVDVNLRGTLYMSQAVIPAMKEQNGGSIVCMSSVSAQRGGGIFGGPHYSAAKAGVLGLAKAMAREFGPNRIRVNSITPGLIQTDITGDKLTPEMRVEIIKGIPLGRLGDAADVANACLFLVSDLSSYLTGVTLDVNGGMLIH